MMATPVLTEDALIEYIKPILKAQGFKKKGKRWTKVLDDFTLVFYIQGSCYSKEDYYIRPGVFMNHCPEQAFYYYGHFMTQIKITHPQTILEEALAFFSEWTDKSLIVSRAKVFVEWDKRNPLEKRRTGLVDEKKDPPPSRVFFGIRESEMNYILNQL